MIAFFRNAFRMGGAPPSLPSLETAPVFAARLVVEGTPITELVTAGSGTCPTYGNGAFVNGDCQNGVTRHAGVLANPGVQAHFFSNMAFRRVRWVQESFVCRKFPGEYGPQPVEVAGALYTAPWPYASITGGANAPVDFLDTKSVVCANCHATMNHLAPLFGRFDDKGLLQPTIQVTTPIGGLPKTRLTDWLPPGEEAAWRLGVPTADLPALGKAIAADPAFAACMATRAYDWAMSKDDVINDPARVPEAVIAPYRDEPIKSGYSLRAVLYKSFTSDDYVRFYTESR